MEQKYSRDTEFSWHITYKAIMGDAYAILSDGLKNKKLLGNVCTSCNEIHFPAKPFCEMCFSECTGSVEMEEEATLITYTICWIPLPKLPNPPSITGVFKLGNSITNFIHNISGIEAETPAELSSQLKLGMKFRPVWKEDTERHGHMFDIAHFTPV